MLRTGHSSTLGDLFIRAGVPHVIAVSVDAKIADQVGWDMNDIPCATFCQRLHATDKSVRHSQLVVIVDVLPIGKHGVRQEFLRQFVYG